MQNKLVHSFAAAMIILTSWTITTASDHYDGPAVLADPSIDITDMYVFPSPSQSDRLVLVLDVHPNAGPSAWFSDALEYRFRLRPVSISGTGEKAGFNVSDRELVFSFTFSDLEQTGKDKTQAGKCHTPTGKVNLNVNHGTADEEYSKTGVRVLAGLRLDPFFMDVPGFMRSILEGKVDFRGFKKPQINCLSIILELDKARFLPDAKGMYGVVSEVRTRGKRPIVLDTFGRPETTNVILLNQEFDKINRDLEVRDIFNEFDPFGDPAPYGGPFRERFNANLHRIDSMDGRIDWPLKDGVHPLTELHLADFTVIDLSKSVGIGSWLEIEKAIVEGRKHKTGGGRWLDDDMCDIQYTFLIARDREKISDLVDEPNKPAMKKFPYLHEPQLGPAPVLNFR